jgi:hypothetical protein
MYVHNLRVFSDYKHENCVNLKFLLDATWPGTLVSRITKDI